VGDLRLFYVSTGHQPTDIFTKSLGMKQFVYLQDKRGMVILMCHL